MCHSINIFVMDAGAAIGGISNMFGGLFNLFGTWDTNDTNRELYYDSVNVAKDMQKSQQDYSTYMMQNQKQMQMLDAKKAGVNPAVAQGTQLGANAASSGSQSAPPPIPMQRPDYSFIGQGVQSVLNYLLEKKKIDAEAQNLYADTYKKLAETERQQIENEYLPALMRGDVDIKTNTISVLASIKFKNEWEAKNFAQQVFESGHRIEKIDEETKQIQSVIANIDVDTRIKRIQEFYESDRCQSIINQLQASADLSHEEARDLVLTRAARVSLLDAQGLETLEKALNIPIERENLRKYGNILNVEGDQMDFNLKSDKKYRNKERALGIINGATTAAKNTTSAISELYGAFNPVKGMNKTSDIGNGYNVTTTPNSYYGSGGYRRTSSR